MQVATIVDKVDLRKDQYHISSTGTLGTVLSTALNDQKLIRDSVGRIGPNGMVTNTYQEKRGNTELLIAKVEKGVVNFIKCHRALHLWVARLIPAAYSIC